MVLRRSRQLGVIAGVVPGDDWGDGLAAVIQQHPGFGQAGDPQCGDRSGWAVGQRVGQRGLRRCQQGVGVQFGAEAVNIHGVSARPVATASPASVNTTALLVWVPTSRPTKSVLRISIP